MDFSGTWVLDRDACRYQWGPPPRDVTTVITETPAGLRLDVDWVDAYGERRAMTHELVYGESPGFELLRTDARTVAARVTDGRPGIALAVRALSEDGATLTVTQSGTDPEGDPFENVAVYRRA